MSEAIERHRDFSPLKSLVPGSWIHANFNVWIGAPEDNRAWDYLYHARNFYAQAAPEGHRSAAAAGVRRNPDCRRQRLELVVRPRAPFRQRSRIRRTLPQASFEYLSALGARPPDYLAQPIIGGAERPAVLPQTAYIHPRITGDMVRYFEWMGAAVYTADRRAGAMHGKQFLLDAVHAGIDESTSTDASTLSSTKFRPRISKSWSILNHGRRRVRATTRIASRCGSGSRQDTELEGRCSRCRAGLCRL